jgi:uncharacterized repeat protein (TIGR02543 family)
MPLQGVLNTHGRGKIVCKFSACLSVYIDFYKKSECHFVTLRYRFLFSCFDKVLTYLGNSSFVMRIDGVIVTHNAGSTGEGVVVDFNGRFMLVNGEIIGNYGNAVGGGVLAKGSFEMSGGVIANNTAVRSGGGGVYVTDRFIMSGGVIANNTSGVGGGGVHVWYGSFVMSGGMIANNTAPLGGGVAVYVGSFVMSGGMIANNTAYRISINGAPVNGYGGGVYVSGSFSMSGGVIAQNTATNGGGVSVEGAFSISNGVISGNTAINGGGVWVTDTNAIADFEKLFVGESVVFSNNRASVAYNRSRLYDSVYEMQIKGTNWTTPFTQGYNNYDISYTYGESIAIYSVSVSGSSVALSGAGNYLAGSLVVVDAGSRSDYVFAGWTVSAGGISLSNTSVATFTMPTRNVILTANWAPNSSGDGSSPKPSSSDSVPNESKPSTPPPRPSYGDDGEASFMWDSRSIALLVVLLFVVLVVVVIILVVLLLRMGARV